MQSVPKPQSQKTEILYEVNWDELERVEDSENTSGTARVEEIPLGTSSPDGGIPSPSDDEFELISEDEAFAAPIQNISPLPPPGRGDHIPVVSQVKSIIHLAKGNEIAAKRTQENFSKGALGVSQVRSLVEFAKGDGEAAKETQEYFWNSRFRNIDKTPIVGHVKGGIHYLLGNKEKGASIIKNSTDTIMNTSLFGGLSRRSESVNVNQRNTDGNDEFAEDDEGIPEMTDCMEVLDMEEEENYMEYNKCKLEFRSCYLPD